VHVASSTRWFHRYALELRDQPRQAAHGIAKRALGAGAVSPRIQWLAVVALGAAGAAWVGYQTATNPRAGPPHAAVLLRVAIILTLILSGLYAHVSRNQRSMGRLLLVAGFFSCLWLLNGSSGQIAFSVGFLASGLAPGLFCYLMLAFPSGRVKSRLERRFIMTSTGIMAFVWALAVFSQSQPVLSTPLLRCAPHCPNALSLGLPDAHDGLAVLLRTAWLVIAAGTALLVVRRARRATAHFRLLLLPMVAVAVANALLIPAFMISKLDHWQSATALGVAYVATALAIPLAIFVGLAMERLSLGGVLAQFVAALGTPPGQNVQSAMASTLNDPKLRIFYRRGGSAEFVDADGEPLLEPSEGGDRRQTVIESAGQALAVVDFDANLSDQEDFIKATGKSAAIWLEKERLAAELAASMSSLEASRVRLARTADEERRRIQRDLHDGSQQHLIAMHLKLELALEAIAADPARCARLLAEIGEEMGETASDLRSLTSDVFPPTLREYGLVDALRSAIRRMGIRARLEAHGVGRQPAETETQVYFVCLEALQNMSKHGGPGATATLRLWQDKRRLYFVLRDSGVGFDPEAVEAGRGLLNMRDRLEAVGGRLRIRSSDGCGTAIGGVVPVRRPTKGGHQEPTFAPPRARIEAGAA
jgi:signal transduction histidine kinase